MNHKNKPHLLFVCARNKWRSPTAVKIYKNDERVLVRSAGMRGGKGHQLSMDDLNWANLILVMEQGYKAWILGKFRDITLPPIFSLDIPDEYEFMNEELIECIKNGTGYHIKQLLKSFNGDND